MKKLINYFIALILILSIFIGIHYLVAFLANVVNEYIIAFVLLPLMIMTALIID